MPERPLWTNAFGEPVDLDNIDREYALNIYTMVIKRRGLWMCSDEQIREDPLVQKLREVILAGAKKRPSDRLRAIRYNVKARAAGIRFRAPVK